MNDKILEIWPEINWIKDEGLGIKLWTPGFTP